MDAERHRRLKGLFLQVRELPRTKRDEFIKQICGDDLKLEEELLALLRHDQTRTLLTSESTVVAAAKSSSNSALSSLSSLSIPQRLKAISKGHLVVLSSVITLVGVLAFGTLLHQSIRQAMRDHLARQLQAHCHVTSTALLNQLDHGLEEVTVWGIDPELAAAVVEVSSQELPVEDRQLEKHCPEFSANLRRFWGADVTSTVWNREQVKVLSTSNNPAALLASSTETGSQLLNRVLKGESALYLPNSLESISEGIELEPGWHTMAYIVPIRASANSKVVGALLVRNDEIEENFYQVFESSSFLKSGEMYAFSSDARMISRPRFADQLEQLGLMETLPKLASTSIISLRDPGGDMTQGFVPTEPRETQSPTDLIRRSKVEKIGVNTSGYRDYRGRRVVGAWEWLDRYQFGVALEIDEAEIGQPFTALNYAFVLAALTCVVAAIWVILSEIFTGANRASTTGWERLGPYHLEAVIGEGGMGKVYRARHELLKRPTAIKVLKPELATEKMIRRFQREVECASQLQHPNTVDIYDFGSTSDGKFYYVMEHLNGMSLHQLVRMFGPLGPARAVRITKQICGSLREAHMLGLVHRDIKPQNIMVCACGGEADIVKVVDFGLVKEQSANSQPGETGLNEWVGTPKYMPPERLLQPTLADPRGDIYSTGAVLYWMLSGHDPFQDDGLQGLITEIVVKPPDPIAGQFNISPSLEHLVMKCLAKVPSERYASMEELIQALDTVVLYDSWSEELTNTWWQENLPEYWQIPQFHENATV